MSPRARSSSSDDGSQQPHGDELGSSTLAARVLATIDRLLGMLDAKGRSAGRSR